MGMHSRRLIAVAFILVALMIVLVAQNSTSFLLFFPILLLLLVVSWYLYREIQRDNEETLKREIKYMEEERDAQVWLHKSFVPRMQKFARKEMRLVIAANGFLLACFIFLWTFFVGGLHAAFINTLVGLCFFLVFVLYALDAPKEFDHIFRHAPRRLRHHSKNNWVHAYLLLFPFAIIGFFLYSLTTGGEGVIESLIATVIFIFSYTFLFIGIYSIWFLYQEYQKEREESLQKTAKKILKD